MDATFSTVVRLFGSGQEATGETPPNICVVEATGARRHRGSLYLLIETLGAFPDPAYVMQRLAEVLRNEYYQTGGSVTGGISAALRAANDWLFEENKNAPREQRGVAGVTCAVLREGELFLGQVGPALCYLLQSEGLRRFPEESPWLRAAIPTETERAASPPLGIRRVLEPLFYHAVLDAGDSFVLASPVLARLTSPQAIAQALQQGPDVALQHLQLLAHGRDLNLLLVGLEADETPVPLRAPTPDIEEPQVVAAPPRHQPAPQQPTARRTRRGPDWARLKQGTLTALRRMGRALWALLQNVRPERTPSPPRAARKPAATAASPARPIAGRTLSMLAVLIPVLVVAAVLITRWQYDHTRRAQVADLLRRASEARASVANLAQRDAQRQALRQAVDLASQALALAPDEVAAQQLRQKALEELDQASNVRRLYTMWELVDLGNDPQAPANPSRLLVEGPDLIILDATADRVYRRRLNEAGDALQPPGPDAVLVQKGQTTGAIAVGELVDLLWMPIGGERTRASLMVVERNGSLLEWAPGQGLGVLPVANAATWKKPVAAGGYNGNLYLLDAQASRILKYVATAQGYTNPPVDYIRAASQIDLSGAVDMAIDGNIYVLMADGSIVKFLTGERQPFSIVNLDEPLKNPVALVASGTDDAHGYLYVADAGLARVVQLTKTGEFLRQFKAPEGQMQLQGLRGLYVDEARQRLYLASGSKVYMAALSQSGAPQPVATPAG